MQINNRKKKTKKKKNCLPTDPDFFLAETRPICFDWVIRFYLSWDEYYFSWDEYYFSSDEY